MGLEYAQKYSPPFQGGVAATSQKSREASFEGADGAVLNHLRKEFLLFELINRPVCAGI